MTDNYQASKVFGGQHHAFICLQNRCISCRSNCNATCSKLLKNTVPRCIAALTSCSEGNACSFNSIAACLPGLPLDCAQVPHVQEGHSRAALRPDGISQGHRPKDGQGGIRVARPLPAKGRGLCGLLRCIDAV